MDAARARLSSPWRGAVPGTKQQPPLLLLPLLSRPRRYDFSADFRRRRRRWQDLSIL